MTFNEIDGVIGTFSKRYCSKRVADFLEEHKILYIPDFGKLYCGIGQFTESSIPVHDAILALHDKNIEVYAIHNNKSDNWDLYVENMWREKSNKPINTFSDYLDAVNAGLDYVVEHYWDLI